MVDAVARQDQDRILLAEATVEQALCNAPRRRPGFAIGDAAPAIGRGDAALGDENSVGPRPGMFLQQQSGMVGVGAERLFRFVDKAALALRAAADARCYPQSVGQGKSVSVRVEPGGGVILQNKTLQNN